MRLSAVCTRQQLSSFQNSQYGSFNRQELIVTAVMFETPFFIPYSSVLDMQLHAIAMRRHSDCPSRGGNKTYGIDPELYTNLGKLLKS